MKTIAYPVGPKVRVLCVNLLGKRGGLYDGKCQYGPDSSSVTHTVNCV